MERVTATPDPSLHWLQNHLQVILWGLAQAGDSPGSCSRVVPCPPRSKQHPESNLGCRSKNQWYLMGHQPASSHPIFPWYVLMFALTHDLRYPRACSQRIRDAKRCGRGQMRFQWPGNDTSPQRSCYPVGYFPPPLG